MESQCNHFWSWIALFCVSLFAYCLEWDKAMKLSSKGKNKLVAFSRKYGEYLSSIDKEKPTFPDFAPEDFKDYVVLTPKEAERLIRHLDACDYWLAKTNSPYECDAWAAFLEKRMR